MYHKTHKIFFIYTTKLSIRLEMCANKQGKKFLSADNIVSCCGQWSFLRVFAFLQDGQSLLGVLSPRFKKKIRRKSAGFIRSRTDELSRSMVREFFGLSISPRFEAGNRPFGEENLELWIVIRPRVDSNAKKLQFVQVGSLKTARAGDMG